MNNSLNTRLFILCLKEPGRILLKYRCMNTKNNLVPKDQFVGVSPPQVRHAVLSTGVNGNSNHNQSIWPYSGNLQFVFNRCRSTPNQNLGLAGQTVERFLCSGQPSSTNSSDTKVMSVGVTDNQTIDPTLQPSESSDHIEKLDIEFITGSDQLLLRKLKILFLELDVWHQEGKKVPTPSRIKNEQWKDLLNTTSRSARQKYLTFLWGVEMKKEGKMKKKMVKIQLREQDRDASVDEHVGLRYGIAHNTIFMRVYDTTINQHLNHNLIQAMQFGQKIVVDCGYDSHMSPREAQNAAKQIMLLFGENRAHRDPFDVYLCNANRNSVTLKQLKNYITTLYEDHFPLNITDKSYLELFPKKDIVYLTPHCREELTRFDHDTIYVIGGIVDKVNQEPLSLAKAKSEGLQMAKLPLDHYLNWGSGSGKSLTLNHMMLIMLEMKTSGDWKKALEHVPRRKLYHEEPTGSQYNANQLKRYKAKRDRF